MQAAAPSPCPQHQLHLALFTAHELDAWEQEERRKALRKELQSAKSRPRYGFKEDSFSRSLFDSIDLAVLELPLGGPMGGNELNCDADPFEGCTDEPEPSAAGQGEAWSDEAVSQLHEAVLHYSLRALQARGNRMEKREILEWIFAPQPLVAWSHDDAGQVVEAVLPPELTPFSFERCCRICGYSSERLTDGLMPILKAMGLGQLFNDIANGTSTERAAASGSDSARRQHADAAHAAAVQGSRDLQPA